MSPRLPRPRLDGLMEMVPVDALLDHIDINRLLDHIDVNGLLHRIDVDALVDMIDVDKLIAKVDIQEVLERAQIADLIAETSRGLGERVLESARAQTVGLDHVVDRLVARIRRRGSEPPAGPPRCLT
jgi:hypothetical protein